MRTIEMLIVLSACLLCCCAGVSGRGSIRTLPPASPTDYRLEIAEDRENQRFDLRLVSTTNRRLCIGEHQWPNSLGQLHFASTDIYVIVAGVKYGVKERNMGYPEGTLRIPAHGQLTGFLSFDEFDAGWRTNLDEGHRLVFPVQPFYCD